MADEKDGQLCPKCGKNPVKDWNIFPQRFWDSDIQHVTCESCRTRISRFVGAGRNFGRGPSLGYPPKGGWMIR